MMKCILATLALIFFANIGCANGTAEAIDFTTEDWKLVSLDGAAVAFEATINLGKPGHVSGQAPCNRYFGGVTSEGASLTFDALGATMMACENMQAETAFLAALQAVNTAAREDDTLRLTGGGHELVFALPAD